MQQVIGQGMPGPHTLVMAKNRRAGQCQITKRIQHLVAYGLVHVTQPTGAENLGAIHDHSIFQRPAKRQPVGTHGVDVGFSAECAAIAQFTYKAAVRHVQGLFLNPNRSILELDAEFDQKRLMRRQTRPSLTARHRDGPQDAKSLDRVTQEPEAARKNATDKGRRTAIQDWDLGAIHFNQGIVDATPHERRHDMLNRRNRNAVVILKTCAKRRLMYAAIPCRQVSRPANDIHTPKDDAVISLGWANRQARGKAAMQPNTLKRYR